MTTIYFIIFIAFVIGVFLTIKIELPKRLKKERQLWESEKKREKFKINYEAKQNLEIQKVVNEEKQKAFEENRRKRAREHHINMEKKGKEYELYIAEHFRKQGYKIKEYGIINGKKDHGVDVIAMKDKEITLIQCKNWKKENKYKVDHNMIKAFIGNTTEFLEKNRDKADGYDIKRLFVTSDDILDNSARYFIKDSNLVEHRVIPIEA